MVDIELFLIHFSPSNSEARKKNSAEIVWANHIKNKCIKIGIHELFWQPCLKHIRGANLIIVEQASKLILNYMFFYVRWLVFRRFVFGGMGRISKNIMQALLEKVSVTLCPIMFWCFVYNDLSVTVVMSLGYPVNE